MKSLCIKLLLIFTLSCTVCAFSPSASVVVQMAQHDSDRESLRESTFILENGVMDVFYESGFIVSSLPTTINKDIDTTLKESIAIAKAGYMSYVVYINVHYIPYGYETIETITLEDIDSVDWKIVSTSDMSVLGEGKTEAISKNEGETDFVAMKRFSNNLGADIKSDFDKKI